MSNLEKATKNMEKESKKLSEAVNSITGTNCVTVYSVLKESGVKFSQADITKIGQAVVKKLGKINRPKERQQEIFDGKEYTPNVFVYQESEVESIQEVIVEYYSNLKK